MPVCYGIIYVNTILFQNIFSGFIVAFGHSSVLKSVQEA